MGYGMSRMFAKEEGFAGFTDLYGMNTTSEDLLTLAALPEQGGASSRPAVGSEKELALRRAVLKDALNCFQRLCLTPRAKGNRRLAEETAAWFFTDDEQWPFSFVHVCWALGLDSSYLRRGLLLSMQRAASPSFHKPSRTTGLRFKLAA